MGLTVWLKRGGDPRHHGEVVETPLQQAQRHVLEGAARISRQEALIGDLTAAGRSHMLSDAYAVLANFRQLQSLSEEHLRNLLLG